MVALIGSEQHLGDMTTMIRKTIPPVATLRLAPMVIVMDAIHGRRRDRGGRAMTVLGATRELDRSRDGWLLGSSF